MDYGPLDNTPGSAPVPELYNIRLYVYIIYIVSTFCMRVDHLGNKRCTKIEYYLNKTSYAKKTFVPCLNIFLFFQC